VIAPERGTALRRASALIDVGRVEDAASVYTNLLREEPDDVQSLCGLSRCLGKLGRTREGLELAERAAALAPEDDWPHRLRSAQLMQLGRTADGLRAAREAVRLDPDGFAPLLTLFEAETGRRMAGAATATADRVRRRYPSQPEAHNCVGRAAMLRRDWRAAEAAFREALQLRPQEPVYQSNLALAVERRGRKKEAMHLFQQAVRTDPGSQNARRQLVHAVQRRIAVLGLGAGVAGAVAAFAARRLLDTEAWAAWAAAAAVVLLACAIGLGIRWWRLRSFDESVRRLYRMERKHPRALALVALGAAVLTGVVAILGLVFGLVGWLTGSPLVGLGAVVLVLLLLRYPGLTLLQRHVLPVVLARCGPLRG
jgi:Flp pilus assembly protein TadD